VDGWRHFPRPAQSNDSEMGHHHPKWGSSNVAQVFPPKVAVSIGDPKK
jgi:hypothetical protein